MQQSPAKEHVLCDLQAVGVQGGAGLVAQHPTRAVQLPVDPGAGQLHRAHLADADRLEPAAKEHVLCDRLLDELLTGPRTDDAAVIAVRISDAWGR
jgi:hypothetical protein